MTFRMGSLPVPGCAQESSKQILPVSTSSIEVCSGFTAQISVDFIYPEHTALGLLGWHVAHETKPSVYFTMEELPMLGHAKWVKTRKPCWAMRDNPGIPVLVPPGKEEDVPACLPACLTSRQRRADNEENSSLLKSSILAACACLQLDGNLSAGFSSPGILGDLTAPACLIRCEVPCYILDKLGE